ncbi:MAG: hypothetical protein RLZZ165_1031 [Bacteroidota bacterium]
MKKYTAVFLAAFWGVLASWSCSYHNVEDDLSPSCAAIPVSFSDTILPIMVKYCAGNGLGDCHQAGTAYGLPDLSAYAGIQQEVMGGRIQARVFDRNPSPMPPSYSNGPKDMSDCEKTLVQRWIDGGAPNN